MVSLHPKFNREPSEYFWFDDMVDFDRGTLFSYGIIRVKNHHHNAFILPGNTTEKWSGGL
ncbi:MAG: hypothetical protein DRN07_03965 [Thermoplasmata archaeon]|nr:MAG: hypothetical protein DRN07_03965 [Thermoplasmata archaeon]